MDKYLELRHLVKDFNWNQPSWDLFILGFWLIAAVLYATVAGRGRILSILVSVFMAKLLVLEAPFLNSVINSKLNIVTASLQQLATFGALFVVLFFFLSKYAFRTAAEGRHGSTFLFGIPFAVLQVGLLINIVLGFMPPHVQATLNPLIRYMFLQNGASFVWLLAPVAYLILFGKYLSHKSE